MSFSEEALKQYYQTNFLLFYEHNKDPRILDDMIPWEKDIILTMMIARIEEENLKAEQERHKRQSKR